MRETNRRRQRSVAERVRQERWEMVLLTELKADEEGVVWLGEDEERALCDVSPPRCAEGYAGVGGGNMLPSAPVAAKITSVDGGGAGVSSQDGVLEEAAVGTVALLLVVTWNVRRLSVSETNRRRLRSVAERVRQERWEMVLLTELRADEVGVFFWGGRRREGGTDPGEKAGVMQRGEAMEKWVEGGQQKWFGRGW